MGVAIRTADPALYAEIQASYKEAMAKGLWKNHYASTNANEYWAEGAQTWFWSNYEYMDGETRVQTMSITARTFHRHGAAALGDYGPGYASLPACSLGERPIDRNQSPPNRRRCLPKSGSDQ